MRRLKHWSLMLLLALGGCATIPNGPSVMVLPTPGKPFEQFVSEDGDCRAWAQRQLGVSPEEAANRTTAKGLRWGPPSVQVPEQHWAPSPETPV